jgi:hypothetical protein
MTPKSMRWICLFPSLLIFAALAHLPADEPPETQISRRIERLIAELDDIRYSVREAASAELKQIGPPAEAALRRVVKSSGSAEVRMRAKAILPLIVTRFEGKSAGWSWIYGSIAHGQTFQSVGQKIQSMQLRVARLNETPPAGPLSVEIRDLTLKHTYARGEIAIHQAQRKFVWREVKWDDLAPLVPEQSYVLLFHSQATTNEAPWLVNEIYADLYPNGRHLGYEFDFFLRLFFTNGRTIDVGPDSETVEATPINSGDKGGTQRVGEPLTLVGFGEVPEGSFVGLPR